MGVSGLRGGCCPVGSCLCPWHITHTLRLIIGYLSADNKQEQRQPPKGVAWVDKWGWHGVVARRRIPKNLNLRATPNCCHLAPAQRAPHLTLSFRPRSVIFMGRQKEAKKNGKYIYTHIASREETEEKNLPLGGPIKISATDDNVDDDDYENGDEDEDGDGDGDGDDYENG